jgi:predicted metal-dependent hydrolase
MRDRQKSTALRAGDGPAALTTKDGKPVVVKRSNRRRRTVSAGWREGEIIISIPGHFTAAQERQWVARMVARLEAKSEADVGKRKVRSDEALMHRATMLSGRYISGNPCPESIRWVSNQNGRWGSCTPARGTIRISDKIEGMPQWVIDYVILHELAHLVVPGHGPDFWSVLEPYPDLARAKAFLDGAAFAMGRGLSDSGGDLPDDDVDD